MMTPLVKVVQMYHFQEWFDLNAHNENESISLKHKLHWKLWNAYFESFELAMFFFLQYPQAIQSVERDTVSLLLQEHADPNLKDIYGQTALHHAIRNDTPSIVAALLDSGCNMEEPSKVKIT